MFIFLETLKTLWYHLPISHPLLVTINNPVLFTQWHIFMVANCQWWDTYMYIFKHCISAALPLAGKKISQWEEKCAYEVPWYEWVLEFLPRLHNAHTATTYKHSSVCRCVRVSQRFAMHIAQCTRKSIHSQNAADQRKWKLPTGKMENISSSPFEQIRTAEQWTIPWLWLDKLIHWSLLCLLFHCGVSMNL